MLRINRVGASVFSERVFDSDKPLVEIKNETPEMISNDQRFRG
jgi:hypothetical protein